MEVVFCFWMVGRGAGQHGLPPSQGTTGGTDGIAGGIPTDRRANQPHPLRPLRGTSGQGPALRTAHRRLRFPVRNQSLPTHPADPELGGQPGVRDMAGPGIYDTVGGVFRD